MIELMPAFVGIATPEGRMLFVNASGCAMLGLEPAAVVNLTVRDLHPAAAAERLARDGFASAQARGWWTADSNLRHRDGREIPVTQTVVAHRSATGSLRYYSLVARDVSSAR